MELDDWIETILDGGCVVVNIKAGKPRQRYGSLLEWAVAQGKYVYVGRNVLRAHGNPYLKPPFDWHNPYKLDKDGTREQIVERFEHEYLPSRPDLVKRLPELKGKVLGCWCAPEQCHGDVLARLERRRRSALD